MRLLDKYILREYLKIFLIPSICKSSILTGYPKDKIEALIS